MNFLTIFPYVGIGTILCLLVVFEIRFAGGGIYTYYTVQHGPVEIRHLFGTHYRVYVAADSSLASRTNRRDRYGAYFPLRAGSAAEAERRTDSMLS